MLGDQKKYVTVDSGNVGEKASYSVEKAEKAPEKKVLTPAADVTVTHHLSSIPEITART